MINYEIFRSESGYNLQIFFKNKIYYRSVVRIRSTAVCGAITDIDALKMKHPVVFCLFENV